jgi:hypothetical protein
MIGSLKHYNFPFYGVGIGQGKVLESVFRPFANPDRYDLLLRVVVVRNWILSDWSLKRLLVDIPTFSILAKLWQLNLCVGTVLLPKDLPKLLGKPSTMAHYKRISRSGYC